MVRLYQLNSRNFASLLVPGATPATCEQQALNVLNVQMNEACFRFIVTARQGQAKTDVKCPLSCKPLGYC